MSVAGILRLIYIINLVFNKQSSLYMIIKTEITTREILVKLKDIYIRRQTTCIHTYKTSTWIKYIYVIGGKFYLC